MRTTTQVIDKTQTVSQVEKNISSTTPLNRSQVGDEGSTQSKRRRPVRRTTVNTSKTSALPPAPLRSYPSHQLRAETLSNLTSEEYENFSKTESVLSSATDNSSNLFLKAGAVTEASVSVRDPKENYTLRLPTQDANRIESKRRDEAIAKIQDPIGYHLGKLKRRVAKYTQDLDWRVERNVEFLGSTHVYITLREIQKELRMLAKENVRDSAVPPQSNEVILEITAVVKKIAAVFNARKNIQSLKMAVADALDVIKESQNEDSVQALTELSGIMKGEYQSSKKLLIEAKEVVNSFCPKEYYLKKQAHFEAKGQPLKACNTQSEKLQQLQKRMASLQDVFDKNMHLTEDTNLELIRKIASQVEIEVDDFTQEGKAARHSTSSSDKASDSQQSLASNERNLEAQFFTKENVSQTTINTIAKVESWVNESTDSIIISKEEKVTPYSTPSSDKASDSQQSLAINESNLEAQFFIENNASHATIRPVRTTESWVNSENTDRIISLNAAVSSKPESKAQEIRSSASKVENGTIYNIEDFKQKITASVMNLNAAFKSKRKSKIREAWDSLVDLVLRAKDHLALKQFISLIRNVYFTLKPKLNKETSQLIWFNFSQWSIANPEKAAIHAHPKRRRNRHHTSQHRSSEPRKHRSRSLPPVERTPDVPNDLAVALKRLQDEQTSQKKDKGVEFNATVTKVAYVKYKKAKEQEIAPVKEQEAVPVKYDDVDWDDVPNEESSAVPPTTGAQEKDSDHESIAPTQGPALSEKSVASASSARSSIVSQEVPPAYKEADPLEGHVTPTPSRRPNLPGDRFFQEHSTYHRRHNPHHVRRKRKEGTSSTQDDNRMEYQHIQKGIKLWGMIKITGDRRTIIKGSEEFIQHMIEEQGLNNKTSSNNKLTFSKSW